MTNQELQKAVAEVIGWTKVAERDYQELSHPPIKVIMGKPPGYDDYGYVPNWPADLPACMAPGGPWEWLVGQECMPCLQTETVLEAGEGIKRYASCSLLLVGEEERDNFPDTFSFEVLGLAAYALAICHAVLAVAEKLKE